MSLERKDVRAKLDPEIHSALSVLAEVDGVDIGQFIERELVRVITKRVHDAQAIAHRAPGLGIAGILNGKSGNGRQ